MTPFWQSTGSSLIGSLDYCSDVRFHTWFGFGFHRHVNSPLTFQLIATLKSCRHDLQASVQLRVLQNSRSMIGDVVHCWPVSFTSHVEVNKEAQFTVGRGSGTDLGLWVVSFLR